MQTFAQAGKGGPLGSGANTKSARRKWALLWSEAEQKTKAKVNVFCFWACEWHPGHEQTQNTKRNKSKCFCFWACEWHPGHEQAQTQKGNNTQEKKVKGIQASPLTCFSFSV